MFRKKHIEIQGKNCKEKSTQEGKVLIEINKGEYEGKVYTLFVSNEVPYPAYVGEVLEGNRIEFVKDKPLAIKILKELAKDELTAEKIKPLITTDEEK